VENDPRNNFPLKQGMVKRTSRENANDRKASEDLSDGSGGPPHKKKKYNLRKRTRSGSGSPPGQADKKRSRKKDDKEEILWIDDDTLQDSDSDDSSYRTEDAEEEELIPSVNIHIHTTLPSEGLKKEWGGEEKKSEDDFLGYLLEKYGKGVPVGEEDEDEESEEEEKPKRKSKSKEKETIPIKLNYSEKKYFNSLKKQKQKEFLKVMERVAKLGLEEGDIPYKFKVLDMPISDYMKSHVIKKINMLSEMSSDGGESHKLKNWIDGLLRIPFGKTVPLPVQVEDGQQKCNEFMMNAKATMNKSIYGMNSAKIQIMQIIAQWIVNPTSVGNVIALKGPMGVGKTSFAKNAIAKVLNRPFEFFSLGGASDISNYVGHSYTYEGSIWGRIADCLMHAGSMNPVLYFDEVDKISTTPHGEEIISMLIHLTDRSQNNQFHDRYFSGIDFDLSQCLFVFSLNDIERVHPILRDRMTVIQCDGYNEKDKTEILKGYIWPQLLDRLRFDHEDIKFTDDGLKFLINEYSKEEKGVRTLIRTVEAMMTRLNMIRVADKETMSEYPFYMDIQLPLLIDEKVIKTLLGDINPKEPESWRSMYT
jgi:ATP-dependent Lon protease